MYVKTNNILIYKFTFKIRNDKNLIILLICGWVTQY